MTAIATRPKLAAVLGMMGSAHDGEALAAARKAERIRRQLGVSWFALLGLDNPGGLDPWATMVAACQAHPEHLTEWEEDFLETLAGYADRRPSRKQARALADIAARVL